MSVRPTVRKPTPFALQWVRFRGLRDTRRKIKSALVLTVITVLAFSALIPLISIASYVIQKGVSTLELGFFTELPRPISQPGGGIANAILGSGILVLLASLMGVPIGVMSGMYLSEYKFKSMTKWVRFAADLLTNVPSIVIGLFAYAVIVRPMHGFSGYAGGFALAVIMIPIVARTTEEMLKLVPDSIREAGLALGLPRWKVTLWIVFRGSLSGIITGVMLAVARVAGETAPLLFTAFGSKYFPRTLSEPMASIPVQIYTYAVSPYEDWHAKAWAGALVLVVFVFVINLIVRWVFRKSGGGVQRA